ncbi:hypothetical protein H920_06301 [Fukomys damarensis]|uniref:Uncharacterized protein n=1 Tax=Fukomys damarensis TaxID=885580 RepID=A0A091DJQ2_FUKDA|nr:hypothetical protein H920_06301 [Fukomys damarensis]
MEPAAARPVYFGDCETEYGRDQAVKSEPHNWLFIELVARLILPEVRIVEIYLKYYPILRTKNKSIKSSDRPLSRASDQRGNCHKAGLAFPFMRMERRSGQTVPVKPNLPDRRTAPALTTYVTMECYRVAECAPSRSREISNPTVASDKALRTLHRPPLQSFKSPCHECRSAPNFR